MPWKDLKQWHSCTDVVNDPVNPNKGGESFSIFQVFLFLVVLPHHHHPFTLLCLMPPLHENENWKPTLLLSSISLTFFNRQDPRLRSTPLHSPYLSTPPSPLPPWTLFIHFARLRHSRGTGRSSLCASLGGCLLACGLSCASAWLTDWGSTPGRWCIGRARRHCGCAGAWSWPSSPWIAGGTACTQMASHLRVTGREQKTTVEFDKSTI